jgi:hypothetical protein
MDTGFDHLAILLTEAESIFEPHQIFRRACVEADERLWLIAITWRQNT